MVYDLEFVVCWRERRNKTKKVFFVRVYEAEDDSRWSKTERKSLKFFWDQIDGRLSATEMLNEIEELPIGLQVFSMH